MKTWDRTKFSAWLRVAIDDLLACHREGMTVDMFHWYQPEKCTVCLAGAVMVKEFGCRISAAKGEFEVTPYDMFDAHAFEIRALRALNYLREGGIHNALETFYGKVFYEYGFDNPPLEFDEFIKWLNDWQMRLEVEGL